jgi:hypothetical protein
MAASFREPIVARIAMILDSVGDGMYWGYEDGSAALYATVDESNVLITASNGVLVISSTKSMRNVSCTVSRMTSASHTQPGR